MRTLVPRTNLSLMLRHLRTRHFWVRIRVLNARVRVLGRRFPLGNRWDLREGEGWLIGEEWEERKEDVETVIGCIVAW